MEGGCIVVPAAGLSQELVLGSVTDVPSDDMTVLGSSNHALLVETNTPLEPEQLRGALEAMLSCGEAHPALGAVMRTVVQLTQLDGPLRMLGEPSSYGDLPTLQQHLSLLIGQLNMLHDPAALGSFVRSPSFHRAKYELFALHHLQLLTWYEQVQIGMVSMAGKSGHELPLYVARLAQAARLRFLQALVVHMAQVASYLRSLTGEEVTGSMLHATSLPSDSASDAERVEWAQLNLLVQVQALHKDTLCNLTLFDAQQYSQAEAHLLSSLLGLEGIATFLIRLFSTTCSLLEQERAVLMELYQKVLKYFSDAKQIKGVLEQNPQQGKAILVANGLASSHQFAVREWTLPFFDVLGKLLKAQWALWLQHKRKESRRRGTEQLVRLAARCALQQLQERGRRQARVECAPGLRELEKPPSPVGSSEHQPPPQPVHQEEPAAPQPQPPPAPEASKPAGWASVVRKNHVDAGAASAPPRPVAIPIARPRPSAAPDEHVRALVVKREQARFSRDFDAADKLRDQLAKLGVSLDDQARTWRAADGRSGPIPPVNVSEMHAQKAARAAGGSSLSDEEIERLVREREQARCTGDFKTADRLRDQLERHGVHLDPKEGKWQAADGRSGPIGMVNISAAYAHKAARAGAPRLSDEEIQRILVQREQARARRDYKTADILRDQLERHGIYLDSKEKKWHSADGSSGAIIVSTLSDEEISRILGARQAARLRHDYKAADRLRDQLNEQGLSVDDKRNRWESSDGRCGTIEPFTLDPASKGGHKGRDEQEHSEAVPIDASAAGSVHSALAPASETMERDGRTLGERDRRELAKQLRAVTQSSVRQCEKALHLHNDDLDRAADWLLSQGDHSGSADADDSISSDVEAAVKRFEQLREESGHPYALVISNLSALSASVVDDFVLFFPASQRIPAVAGEALLTPFKSHQDREQAIDVVRRSANEISIVERVLSSPTPPRKEGASSARILILTVRGSAPSEGSGDAGAGGGTGLEYTRNGSQPAASGALEDHQIRAVVEHIVGLLRSQSRQQADQVVEELQHHGLVVDLQHRHWHARDGRSGGIEPFTLAKPAANGAAGPVFAGNGGPNDAGNLPMSTLTDDKIKVVVDHVAGLVRTNQRPQADELIEEVKRLGLIVDLRQQHWHTTDGRGGSLDPFSCERLMKPPMQNGGQSAAAGAPAVLTDDKIKVVVEHISGLIRNNAHHDADQMIEEVKRLGLVMDLQRKRWHAVDGRHGTLEPFAIEVGNGGGSATADALAPLPSQLAHQQAVSLASVMREQERGKEGSSAAVGIFNPRGAFNCFLSVVVQLLWHAREFREVVAGIEGEDPVLCALKDTFAGLSAAATAASGIITPAVSVEALRVALSATSSGAWFQLGDMADAVEAFEALLERLRECGARRAVESFEWNTLVAGMSYPQLVLYANVADLLQVSSARGANFDDLLREITTDQPGGAHSAIEGRLPSFFTLGLAWPTAHPSKEELSTVIGCIDERINLTKVLGSDYNNGDEAWAKAVGLICYHASHYCAIVRDAAGSWRQFDDSTVTHVGETWLDVRFKCHNAKYQPALVLFELMSAEMAFPPAAAGSETVGTWANMAVRCAVRGGISESSRPANASLVGGARGTANAARPVPGGRKAEVPTAPSKRGPGACHNCDDPNHESRDCPKPCRECGSDKHRIGYHYRARTMVKTSKCFNCSEFGHESRDCSKPCGICQSTQHKSGYHLNDHLYEQGRAPFGGSSAASDRRRPPNSRAQAFTVKGSKA